MRRLIAIAAPTMLLAGCLASEPEPEIGFRPDDYVCDTCDYVVAEETAYVELDDAYASEVATRAVVTLVDEQLESTDFIFVDPGVSHVEVTELELDGPYIPTEVKSGTITVYFESGDRARRHARRDRLSDIATTIPVRAHPWATAGLKP